MVVNPDNAALDSNAMSDQSDSDATRGDIIRLTERCKAAG